MSRVVVGSWWSRFEKIVDRWTVMQGDDRSSPGRQVPVRSCVFAERDAGRGEKVKFDLRLEQSEPIHSFQ
ncbi:hypothetical protein NL676_012452 [Syzygium grande]|nr:hypothetical protein NL676_012452 [Syzygium grande]